MPVNPIVQSLTSMRNGLIYYTITGQHKNYVALRKEFAKAYVTHTAEAEQIPAHNMVYGYLSYYGLNIMKIAFLELFRKKTPEEKLMRKHALDLKAKKEANLIA